SDRAVVGGCWERSAQAPSYRVELARDAEFRDVIASETVPVPSWSSLLGVGRYFMRVRAVDPDGLWSETSAPRQLAVIPFTMPPGASANLDKHTLVVPQGREIALGDTADVDLAVDQGGFYRAPKSFAMDGGPEHSLRFRLTKDPSSTSAVYT